MNDDKSVSLDRVILVTTEGVRRSNLSPINSMRKKTDRRYYVIDGVDRMGWGKVGFFYRTLCYTLSFMRRESVVSLPPPPLFRAKIKIPLNFGGKFEAFWKPYPKTFDSYLVTFDKIAMGCIQSTGCRVRSEGAGMYRKICPSSYELGALHRQSLCFIRCKCQGIGIFDVGHILWTEIHPTFRKASLLKTLINIFFLSRVTSWWEETSMRSGENARTLEIYSL